jgi:uncharacterized membrane protein
MNHTTCNCLRALKDDCVLLLLMLLLMLLLLLLMLLLMLLLRLLRWHDMRREDSDDGYKRGRAMVTQGRKEAFAGGGGGGGEATRAQSRDQSY